MIRYSHTDIVVDIRRKYVLAAQFLLMIGQLLTDATASGQIFARGALAGSMPAQTAFSSSAVPVNPAFLGEQYGSRLAVWIAQMYEIPDLRLVGAAARVDVPLVGLGVRIMRFGFDRFTEEHIEISAGRSISLEGTSPGFGVGIRAVRQSTASASHDMSIHVRAGIHLPATSSVGIGLTIERTLRSSHLTDSINIGVSAKITEQIAVFSDVFLTRDFPESFRNGFETKIATQLRFRGGFSTHPNSISLGLTIPLRRLHVHLGFNRHELLGWSSAVETTFTL